MALIALDGRDAGRLADGRALRILLVGIATNLLPTFIVACGRIDHTARLLIGTLAAVQPTLGVYALTGHEWQMDGRMFSSSRSPVSRSCAISGRSCWQRY